MPIKVVTLKSVERLVGWTEEPEGKQPRPIVKKFPKGHEFEIPDDQAAGAQDLVDAGYVKYVDAPAPSPSIDA